MTARLVAPLSAEDSQPQSMPDASPAKWHLAHTTWFFETFILETDTAYRPFHPEYRVLFNSYYESVGAQHPRPLRGLLTRPTLQEVESYREHVEDALSARLQAGTIDDALLDVLEIGINHEQQHQELILTDIKHLFAQTRLLSRYATTPAAQASDAISRRWVAYPGGLQRIGHDGDGFAFDNELPRHRTVVEPYSITNRLITNGEFLEFIEDGGYENPLLWLSDGWAAARQQAWRAPLYWTHRDDQWMNFTLNGERSLHLDEPALHVSFYEADAFARWAGARLATEAEWELAAGESLKEGNFLESSLFHPRAARPAGGEIAQLFGDTWEWTQSPYTSYPGYRAAQGALGEYNGKFMANQIVLRGGSCVTPHSHIRATYRNFFPPDARWQFSGFRLATSS